MGTTLFFEKSYTQRYKTHNFIPVPQFRPSIPHVGNYVAALNIIIAEPHQKYVVVGASEEEVLAKCLDLIKGVPTKDIFPSLSLASQESE